MTAVSAGAQSMPYNPDANDDGYIGSPDLLSFLPLFGSQVGIDSSLTCDYNGTPIEEFLGNVWNGDIIIDSILLQYHTIDSAEVYIAGCPDPVWESVSYERAHMAANFAESPTWMQWSTNGNSNSFLLQFNSTSGSFFFQIKDDEVYSTQLTDVLGSHYSNPLIEENGSEHWSIPFPTDASSMGENGIHFEYMGGFLSGATYGNIIPFWHYAE